MNKIFFHLLHNRSLRLYGYDPYINRRPDDPVLPLPVISSFTATPATIIVGEDIFSTLRWTVTGATSITIDQGVGDVTFVLGKSVKPSATTTYTLTATNASGSVTRAVTLTVAAAFDPVVADAVAGNLNPTVGQSVEFRGSATGGNGGYAYAWSFSDGLSASATQNTTRSFATAGTYSATLSVTSDGVTASDTVELTVGAGTSAPTVTITHSPASPVVGDEVTYTARVTGGTAPHTYAWTFGDGTSGGTGTTAKKTYRETGTKNLSLTVTGGGTTVATYRITVGVGTPTPSPDLVFLEADPLFDPATGYGDAVTRNLAKAFVEVMSGPNSVILRPDLDSDDVMSLSRTTHVDLYKLRGPKILVNIVRAVLSHKPDPRFVGLLLPFVKKTLDNLVTDWTTYPHDDTPGSVDSNNVVIDRYAADVGQQRWNGEGDGKGGKGSNGSVANPVNTTAKGAWRRWEAWGKSRSRQSPDYRNKKDTHEKKNYRKILYLLASADSSGIARYGGHLHDLDNMMAHVTLGWACYILDVNGSQNAEWQTYGQLGYNYIFNHWLPLTEQTVAERHGAKRASDPESENAEGIMDLRTSLTHNVAAHTSMYALMIKWKEFRRETVNPKDVKALKLMMRFQIDQLKFYNMPSKLYADSSSDQFGNWSHHCEGYREAVDLGDGEDMGQASQTYDREFGGELYNLYRMGLKDDTNRTLTKAMFTRMSKTYAFIVYPKQTTDTFSKLNAMGCAGGGTSDTPNLAYFNDGHRRVDGKWNGSTVTVRYGSGGGAVYSSEGVRHRDAFLGGWYMWADDTPELLATRRWMRRAKHCGDSEFRITPDDFVSSSTPTNRKAWHWVGAYLIMKLENPSRTITGLDLSF